jgi:riboflavin synthase
VTDEGGCTLVISDSALILGDCHIGDSIAVNGACLTVTEFEKDKLGGWFKVWLANETLERTDLGEKAPHNILYCIDSVKAKGRKEIK